MINMMVDSSAAARGKRGWQGVNSAVASTFFPVYSPKGRSRLFPTQGWAPPAPWTP